MKRPMIQFAFISNHIRRKVRETAPGS
jgi:hypothetical protein